jgi:hypothetical protein
MQLLKMTAVTLLSSALVIAQTGRMPSGESSVQPQPAQPQLAAGSSQLTAGQSANGVIPQYVLYRFFFHHLAALDQLAAQRDQVGRGNAWRTHEQRTIGLTDAEAQSMKQVALDCTQAVVELDTKLKAAITDMRAQYPSAQTLPVEARASLRQLQDQRAQIINAHVEQLRSLLGDASFHKMDAYVHTRFQVTRTPVPAPAKTPGTSTNVAPVSVR